MANEEKSRDAFQPAKRYAAVGMQQGRVMLDDDFNENERIRLEEERRVNLDVIGPVGTPDGGFLPANGKSANGGVDFDIGAGTLYLGGLRLWNPSTMRFQQQDDWLQQAAADRAGPVAGQTQLVYIEAWQQPVTAVEDSELFEVALGGPDTSTRTRTMWRVQLANATGTDCPSAWKNLVASWTAQGLGTVDATGERVVDATLEVGFYQGEAGDLCTPAITGGYLGAENQTVRVQIVSPTTFTWGFDNGAPVYRATVGGTGNATVTLGTFPRDQAHWPAPGQVVEILPYGARLPNKEKLAEEQGFLTRVTGAYDANGHTFTVSPGVPAGYGNAWQSRGDAGDLGALGYYVRVWDRGDDVTSPTALTIGNQVKLGNTGLEVTIAGTAIVPGDYWVIAARPKTSNLVVPWDLAQGRAPSGDRRFFAPLALIQWQAGGTFTLLHDCRPSFQPLTDQFDCCCTYTVGDDAISTGRFSSIQAAIDALPTGGGKICVLPGNYPENITVASKQSVVIEGCGPRTVINPSKGTAFTISKSSAITIADLAITTTTDVAISAIDNGDDPGDEIWELVLADLVINVRDESAITVRNASQVTIARNQIAVRVLEKEFEQTTSTGRYAAIFASGEDLWIHENHVETAATALYSKSPFGGIQIGGGSDRVEIRRNHVIGGAGNAITLGSWVYVPQTSLDGVDTNGWIALRKEFIYEPVGYWLYVNGKGCITIGWKPNPPGGTTPLVPISEGDLCDVRIIDNELERAAFGGIAVARFFDEDNFQLITTDRLLIEGNRIHDNLQAADTAIDADMRDLAAFGAIALADGEYIVIRNNVVEDNGPSQTDPICGIFALRAEGISIENNRILDNAPRTDDTSAAKAGYRGGIVLPRVTAPSWPESGANAIYAMSEARRGYPAARIHDNIVFVPVGRALFVIADGALSIVRNQLSTHGVVTPAYSVKGYYGRLEEVEFVPAAYDQAMTGASKPKSSAKKVSLGLLEYSAGTTSGASKYSMKDAWSTNESSTVLGSALLDGLELTGAATVFVLDLGRAPGFELMTGTRVTNEMLGLSEESYIDTTHAALERVTRLPGKVLFADNQVTLDLTSSEVEIFTSVLLISLDDIGVEDNQLEVLATTSPVLIELLVLAWTARGTGNRINQQAPQSSATNTSNLLSALFYGVAAQVTSNLANYCIAAFATKSAWLVNASNIELSAAGGREACRVADEIGALVAFILAEYLLSM